MDEQRIQPNDIVKHIPTDEEWVVCGVDLESGKLIPCGYPFPSIANISDCEIIEKRYHLEPQTKEQIEALQRERLTNFIDPASAMLYDII